MTAGSKFIFSLLSLALPSALTSAPWELKRSENGIQVFVRSVDDSRIREIRSVTTVLSSLSSLVALVEDMASAHQWVPYCREQRVLAKISDVETFTYTASALPWPLSDRDAVVHNWRSQMPDRTVVIRFEGAPDYMPEVPGLIRIRRISGFWQFRPLGSGAVEVIYQILSEPAGNVPDWMVNSGVVDQPYNTILNMRNMLAEDRYRTASIPGLKESPP